MSEQTTRRLLAVATLVLVCCVAAAWRWGLHAALGVFAGGAWNLASLWCLVQLLNAWLGPAPSRKRVWGWLLVKFPLLYFLAFGLLWTKAVSAVGFGVGFSVVLLVILTGMACQAKHLVITRPHGR